MKNFILGQYYRGDSRIHRRDPRAKLAFLLVGLMALFAGEHWLYLALWTALIVVFVLAGKLPLRLLWRNLLPFLPLFIAAFLLNIVFYALPGEENLSIFQRFLQSGVVFQAAYYAVRLVVLILLTSIFILTTSPLEVMDALEALLRPLRRLGVQVQELALIASVAIRFIPTIIDEIDRVRRAQFVRGLAIRGNIFRKVRALPPLILPVLLNTFRRAEDLALAMEARAYDSRRQRTSFVRYIWAAGDTTLVLFGVLLLALAMAV